MSLAPRYHMKEDVCRQVGGYSNLIVSYFEEIILSQLRKDIILLCNEQMLDLFVKCLSTITKIEEVSSSRLFSLRK